MTAQGHADIEATSHTGQRQLVLLRS